MALRPDHRELLAVPVHAVFLAVLDTTARLASPVSRECEVVRANAVAVV